MIISKRKNRALMLGLASSLTTISPVLAEEGSNVMTFTPIHDGNAYVPVTIKISDPSGEVVVKNATVNGNPLPIVDGKVDTQYTPESDAPVVVEYSYSGTPSAVRTLTGSVVSNDYYVTSPNADVYNKQYNLIYIMDTSESRDIYLNDSLYNLREFVTKLGENVNFYVEDYYLNTTNPAIPSDTFTRMTKLPIIDGSLDDSMWYGYERVGEEMTDARIEALIDNIKAKSNFEHTIVVFESDYEGLGGNTAESFIAGTDFWNKYPDVSFLAIEDGNPATTLTAVNEKAYVVGTEADRALALDQLLNEVDKSTVSTLHPSSELVSKTNTINPIQSGIIKVIGKEGDTILYEKQVATGNYGTTHTVVADKVDGKILVEGQEPIQEITINKDETVIIYNYEPIKGVITVIGKQGDVVLYTDTVNSTYGKTQVITAKEVEHKRIVGESTKPEVGNSD